MDKTIVTRSAAGTLNASPGHKIRLAIHSVGIRDSIGVDVADYPRSHEASPGPCKECVAREFLCRACFEGFASAYVQSPDPFRGLPNAIAPGISLAEPWPRISKRTGEPISYSRELGFTGGKKPKPIGKVAECFWPDAVGRIAFTTRRPCPDRMSDMLVGALSRLYDEAGWDAKVSRRRREIKYQEICTHLKEEDAYVRVRPKLPVIIKYAETLGWTLTSYKAGKVVWASNLRLPELRPDVGDAGDVQVVMAVKLYVTRKGQMPKLEFQVGLTRGKWLEESEWNRVVRPTVEKLMIAFLLQCGVTETFMSPAQAQNTIPLPHRPACPDTWEALRGSWERLEIAPVPAVILRWEKLYRLSPADRQVLNSLLKLERQWTSFYEGFEELLASSDMTSRGFPWLRPTRQMLRMDFKAGQREATKNGKERVTVKEWNAALSSSSSLLHNAIIEERRLSRRRLIRIADGPFLMYGASEGILPTIPSSASWTLKFPLSDHECSNESGQRPDADQPPVATGKIGRRRVLSPPVWYAVTQRDSQVEEAHALGGERYPTTIAVRGQETTPMAAGKSKEISMENGHHWRPERKLPTSKLSPPERLYDHALRYALRARDDAEKRITEISSRRRNHAPSQPGQRPDITGWFDHFNELHRACYDRDRARNAIEFIEERIRIQQDYGAN